MLGLVEAVSSMEVITLVFSDTLLNPMSCEEDGCIACRHSDGSEMLSHVSASPLSNGASFGLTVGPGYDGGSCSSDVCVGPGPAEGSTCGGW